MPAGAVQMAVPGHHTPRDIPYTPSAFSVASTGAAAFQTWLEEEEEEWRLAQRLEANCPKEFMCPISLDIMSDPVILVRPYLYAPCPQDAIYQSAARTGLHKYSGSLDLAFDNALQAQIKFLGTSCQAVSMQPLPHAESIVTLVPIDLGVCSPHDWLT